LLEPQRTNVALYSEQFDNAAWTKSNVTISSNTSATLDPSGYNGADKLVEDSSTGDHVTYATQAGTSSTFSFFAKAAERSWVAVLSNNGNMSYFNIGNGTLGTIAATSTATITNYGNGWYRCTLFNSHGTFGASIYLATNNNVSSYAGNGTSGAYIFGAQFEASAAYATSYIPTLAASVTRVADVATKTGISSLIGQTQGTIFAEINLAKLLGIQSRYILVISDNTANNRIYIAFSGASSNILRARIFSAGVQQISIDTGTISSLGKYKLALAYNNNDAVLYVNGVQIGTDTSVTIPACSQLNVCTNQAGASPFDDGINQALLFKTRLTNSELQELTTL
jgi:hypothetical protein